MNTQIISGNRSLLTCIFLLTSEHRLRTGWRIVITLLGFVAVLLNGNSLPHDLTLPDFDAHTAIVAGKGQEADVSFGVHEIGTFAYYCTVPGHRQPGQEGNLIVSEP